MYFSSLQGQGTSFSSGRERGADGVHAGDDALLVLVDLGEDGGADAGHDAHVDDGVGGVGELHADLRHGRADGAHGVGQNVHGAAAHAAAEELLELLAHDEGVFPVVGGAGVVFGEGADEGAVFDAGDVVGGGAGVEAAGPELLVEAGEGAGGDELVAEVVVFGLGAVDPVDGVGLAEVGHLFDPADEVLVGGGWGGDGGVFICVLSIGLNEIFGLWSGEVNSFRCDCPFSARCTGKVPGNLDAVRDGGGGLSGVSCCGEERAMIGWARVLAVVFVLGGVAGAQAPVAAQVIWRLSDPASVGGNTTEVLGHPTVVDTPIGKAIQFNGLDDALFVKVHPLAGAETWTWEMIFKPDADGKPEQRIFHLQSVDPATGKDSANERMLFEIRIHDGQWCLDSFAAANGQSRALLNCEKMHPFGQWYRVTAVYDGTTLRNYVGDELQGEGPLNDSCSASGAASMGTRINMVDYYKGAIYAGRFTRSALKVEDFMKIPARLK